MGINIFKRTSINFFFIMILLVLFNSLCISVVAEDNDDGRILSVEDDFNDNNLNNELWRIVFGSWEEEYSIIHSEDHFIPNPKYLKLKKNISNYDNYSIVVDIVPTPINYSNEYTDGGIVFGENSSNYFKIYIDTSDKSIQFYKQQGVLNYEFFLNETIDELRHDGRYRLCVELNKVNGNNFQIKLKLLDLENTDLQGNYIDLLGETDSDFNDDLNLNKLYLYSTWNKWSAFDYFKLEAEKGIAEIYPPENFSGIQKGDVIELSWSESSNVNGYKIGVSEDDNFENEEFIYNLSKNTIDLIINIDELFENSIISSDTRKLYFGIMAKKGNTLSSVATTQIYLLNSPENFKYIDYGDFIEFRWEHVDNAIKYILKDEDGNPLIDEQGNTIETANNEIRYNKGDADPSRVTVTAYNEDGGYSKPSSHPHEIVLQSVENLRVIQEGNLYKLTWDILPSAEGYEVFSGTYEDVMVKINQDLISDNNYEYDVNGDYGLTRYFKVRAKMEPLAEFDYSGYSEIVAFTPLESPEIIESPNTDEVESGQILTYKIKAYKNSQIADLILDLGQNLEFIQANYNDVELIYTEDNDMIIIDMSNIFENTFKVNLKLKAKDNFTGDIIATNFNLFTKAYEDNRNTLTHLTTAVSSQNINIKPLGDIGNIDFGLLDRKDKTTLITSEEPQTVFYGEELEFKTVISVDSDNVYDPIIKYSFSNNSLFKYELPEPTVLDNDGKEMNYRAVYIKDDDNFIMLIKPVPEGNRLIKNNVYVVRLITRIVSKNKEEIKNLMESKNKPLWRLPYEIKDIINNDPELPDNLLEQDFKMQLLWNTNVKTLTNDSRDCYSSEKIMNLKLENMEELPHAF